MEFQNQNIINSDQVVVIMDQTNPLAEQSVLLPPADSNDSVTKNPTTPTSPPSTKTTTKTLHRLNFSKPKSRFTESNYSPRPKSIQEELQPVDTKQSSSSDDDDWFESEEEEDDDDDDLSEAKKKLHWKKRQRKIEKTPLVEFALFLIIMTCLICSLTLKPLKHRVQWGLEFWKWCLMVLVLFCGRLVSYWLVGFSVFLIERNFMLREKVLYFVYGLRKSFQKCVWLGLALLAWLVMFHGVHERRHKVLKKVFRALLAVFIGATVWLVKILLVKVLASSFHVTTFFDRMKETVFHHFILDALSGPPLDEDQREKLERPHLRPSKSLPARLRERQPARSSSRRIDIERLKKLSLQSRANAWTVRRLVNYIKSSGLSTISRKVVDDFGSGKSEIKSEWEARNCAQRIFKNVAKPGAKYIEEEDLLKFLKGEEVHTIFPHFEGAIETGKISKSSFRNWVVHAYVERKALAHSLDDTKTAVQQLHKLASTVVVVLVIVISLLVMGLATTKVIFLVTTQLLVVGFMFQNTCKTIFESIIFVFVMHPFDVGDRCVIDDVQMIVEEMNILTTVFLRYDMEKIYYPNSVLLTKPISNFRRSPDMGDSIEFAIDISTSIDDFNALKKAIQVYIESKPKHWSPKHVLLVKEIENVDKMKLILCVQHTMNHQNYGEKSSRKSELIFELKKIFESLGIRYRLLPQEIVLTHMNVSN